MSDVNGHCPGSGLVPSKARNRSMPRSPGRGRCPECGNWYKLTGKGLLRAHGGAKAAPEPEPQPEPAVHQPDLGSPAHTNPSADLDDEQYLEQMHLMAQAISVLPGVRDGMPNVSTPPPIRPRWAKFMLSLGFRLHPELATHKLIRQAPVSAGNFGPRDLAPVNGYTPANRARLFELWKKANPETYEAYMAGTMSRDEIGQHLPEQFQAAVVEADRLRAEEIAGDST